MFRSLCRTACVLSLGLVVLAGAGCSDDNPAAPSGESPHADLDGIVVQLADGTELVRQWEATITGELVVTEGATLADLQIWFLDEDQDLVHPGHDHDSGLALLSRRDGEEEEYQLEVDVEDGTVATFVVNEDADFSVDLSGLTAGVTSVRFVVLHEGHADFTSLALPLRVDAAPAAK